MNIGESSVTVATVSSTRRRLEDEIEVEMQRYNIRPSLQAAGGVVVTYAVTAQRTMTDISATLNSVSSTTAVNTALSIVYPGASVSVASVNTPSPSRSPVSASFKIGGNISLSVLLISMALLLHNF